MNHGKQIINTEVKLAVKEYEKILNIEKNNKDRINNTVIEKKYVESYCYIEDKNGKKIEAIDGDDEVIFCYHINSELDLENAYVTLYITTIHGIGLIHVGNKQLFDKFVHVKKGNNIIKIAIEKLNLEGGAYRCMFVLINRDTNNPILDHAYLEPALMVKGVKTNDNILKVNCKWEMV